MCLKCAIFRPEDLSILFRFAFIMFLAVFLPDSEEDDVTQQLFLGGKKAPTSDAIDSWSSFANK